MIEFDIVFQIFMLVSQQKFQEFYSTDIFAKAKNFFVLDISLCPSSYLVHVWKTKLNSLIVYENETYCSNWGTQ